MTVAAQNNSNVIQGDGVNTTFGFTFEVPVGSTGADVFVYIIDNLGNITRITSNFTLNLNAKTVTYPNVGGIAPLGGGVNALPANWQIAIYRIENLQQALSLITAGAFPAAGIMAAFDFLTYIAQQLQEQINRCVKYPIGQVPTTTDVNAFIAAVSAIIMAPWPKGTYAYLKSLAPANPTTPFIGLASDMGETGAFTMVFYCGDAAVGDAGFFVK